MREDLGEKSFIGFLAGDISHLVATWELNVTGHSSLHGGAGSLLGALPPH